MPWADNKGMRIWYEARGEGEPLVLLHGFTSSSAHWKVYGYASALERSHRVVLIDLRGHGKSAKPHERDAYALEHRLADIDAVLNELDIDAAHFCGFSMGGWLSYAMAARSPSMVKSLIIGGAHPYEESFAAFAGIDGSDPDAFIAALESFLGEVISPAMRRMMLLNDLRALCAAATDRASLEPALEGMRVPMMMFVGDLDQRLAAVQEAAQKMDARLVIVPGIAHAGTLGASEMLIPEIRSFLASR
ncbi:MAG TPA: alpha/beta hydrolase [Noviherbaspirillum sp.]|nr:alpha/beta hydrolase [Noviherbaspirillum sp.]